MNAPRSKPGAGVGSNVALAMRCPLAKMGKAKARGVAYSNSTPKPGAKTFGGLEGGGGRGGGGVGGSAGQPPGSPGGVGGYPNIHTSK